MDRATHTADLEAEIRAAGEALFAVASKRKPSLYHGLRGALLARVMDDARLRASLFQFVDVLPQLGDARQVTEHLRAYLADVRLDGLAGWLMRLAARPSLAWAVRRQTDHLARQFLAEESEADIGRTLVRLARLPARATFDAVGEAVLTDAEADDYLQRNLRLLNVIASSSSDAPHVSLKLTALTARFDPLDPVGTRQRVFARLVPIVEAAQHHAATLTIDMEHYELKPMILRLFLEMIEAWPGRWQPAIALQAYLPETGHDIDTLLAAAQRHGRRIGVRLVKGAYWDQECAWAAQRYWPLPTFAHKGDTDAHHESLTRRLLENADSLHPAIASHNLRNQAVALAWARRLGLPPERWEAQMLHGMAEPLRDAVIATGATLRSYVPVGDPIVGIAYLIRRLLENTASTSILRQTYIEGSDFARLMAPPATTTSPNLASGTSRTNEAAFTNLPLIDFSRNEERLAFGNALSAVRAALPRQHGLAHAACSHVARNPAWPEMMLGEVGLADPAQVDAALARATAAFPEWHATAVDERAGLLRGAAALMETRRRELAALEVFEAAKNWREADADVAEAIDYLRYYALQMEHLAGWHRTVGFPGEDNRSIYAPRGVGVVIAPWNFPLAILAGMTSAALAAGNCAVMKPALPGLLIAHAFHETLLAAGLPPDVCQLLPGEADVGERLVADPRTHVVAFTGSRAVGLRILQAAHSPAPGQRHIKQVVCEMGGKNAIIVDEDADLDEAVAGITASAFGYAGQKCSACSRVIAVGGVHDRLLPRLAEAAATLAWGPPDDPAYAHGPLITEAAQRKALDYIEIGKQEGRLVWQGTVPAEGWYVPPTIFADILPSHRLAREEIFGPVLAVMRAADFQTGLAIAQDSDYGLTGGVYSRYPPHLAMAEADYRVGNLYLNRKITGARVGIQPFGGIALSGTGVQAGGVDYLKQFLWSRTVSENTMRHGFIPDE